MRVTLKPAIAAICLAVSVLLSARAAGAGMPMPSKSDFTSKAYSYRTDSPEPEMQSLVVAACCNDTDTVRRLTKAAMQGFTGSTATILSLCKDPARLSYAALIAASLKDKPDLVRVCSDFHCDINGRIYFGMTPLMIASYCGSVKTASQLMSCGADVNLADEDGFTALMYGAMKNAPDIIFHLMRNGADKDKRNKDGKRFEDYTKELDTRTFSQMLADRLRERLPGTARERADEIPEGHQSFGERFEWCMQKYFGRYPENRNSDIYRGQESPSRHSPRYSATGCRASAQRKTRSSRSRSGSS